MFLTFCKIRHLTDYTNVWASIYTPSIFKRQRRAIVGFKLMQKHSQTYSVVSSIKEECNVKIVRDPRKPL